MSMSRGGIMQIVFSLVLLIGGAINGLAQDKLYADEFALKDVSLYSSPFKSAMDRNIETLLEYDVDRLLEPFLKQAGLNPKAAPYVNWDGLAGHIGGHYLTALAMNYAATGSEACKQRLDYMLDELRACQLANGNGYVGGVPDSKLLWADLKNGNFTRYRNAWVPWYNVHKTYAGLRDAWLYANSDLTRQMFLELCDWGIDEISRLSYDQMQTMLDTEFGGMNEVYADAYQMTGEKKYLDAAKRFTHYKIFTPLVLGSDQLDNLHANTQIPKIIGFARIAQLDPSATNYAKAAKFFWQTVVNKRSLAFGGNSRSEHFPSAAACGDYVTSREGPESCNTYNMLKLTEQLFAMDPNAKYVDYYERAVYNHTLSTQHPTLGGYVYFTPARPRHYRVYSAANQAMWCCVGSGMENHGKYGQMIYTHRGSDSLYVNLFIPSVLNWEQGGLQLEQLSGFPDEASSQLIVKAAPATAIKLFVRQPAWVKSDEFEIRINGEKMAVSSAPGTYVIIERAWLAGDVIDLVLPMHFSYEQMPNVPEYLALLYGPIVLGAKTGNKGLDGLIADDGRWSHIANGALEALNTAPVIEGSRDSILDYFKPVTGKPLTFVAPELFPDQANYQSIEFEPFFRIHDSRYMMYWMALSRNDYNAVMAALADDEQEQLELDRRTVDEIATGEQQPDADHVMKGLDTYSGVYNDEYYRDARNGGYFSYEMATGGNPELSLMVRYWGNEGGARTFDILVDNVVIATENVSGKWKINEFVNVEYPIPSNLLKNKEKITVKFSAKTNQTAGGVYYMRLLKPSQTQSYIQQEQVSPKMSVRYEAGDFVVKSFSSDFLSAYHLFSYTGQLIASGEFDHNEARINASDLVSGIYLFQYKNHEKSMCTKLSLYANN